MYVAKIFGYDGYIEVNAFLTGAISIGIISGAYSTEVFRGSIQSINRGQFEASEVLGKKIPLVGLGLGAVFAAQRAMQGDFVGAGLELASGAASTVPGIGTAGSVGIDAALMARDMRAVPFADGGIISDATLGLVGEKGKEGVFPLEGVEGRKTFLMFGEGILDAQFKNKSKFAKLQARGLSQYYDKQNGWEKFADALKSIFKVPECIDRQLLEKMDLIVTTTGNVNVCDRHMLATVKRGAIVCNIGHFDLEIDTKFMRDNWKWEEVKPQVHKIYRSDDDEDYIILLSEGRLVNLGNATGHPSRVMDGSFTNQVLAQMLLYKEAWADKSESEREPVYVKVLPKKLDEEVAAEMVKGFGGVITKMTQQQSEYISTPVEGPFKPETYRYQREFLLKLDL